jgi:phage terminase small subunit
VDDLLSTGQPEKPQSITEDSDASECWDLIINNMHPGMQAAIDANELESLCFWWSQFRHYAKLMRDPSPNLKEERAVQIMAKDAWAAFDKIAARFGMTPADRAKLELRPPGEGDADPLLAMLTKRGDN